MDGAMVGLFVGAIDGDMLGGSISNKNGKRKQAWYETQHYFTFCTFST